MAPAGAVANTRNRVTGPRLPCITSRRHACCYFGYVIRIGHPNQLRKMHIQRRDLDTHAQRREVGNEMAEGSSHATSHSFVLQLPEVHRLVVVVLISRRSPGHLQRTSIRSRAILSTNMCVKVRPEFMAGPESRVPHAAML